MPIISDGGKNKKSKNEKRTKFIACLTRWGGGGGRLFEEPTWQLEYE
jgi:hypothetical protein